MAATESTPEMTKTDIPETVTPEEFYQSLINEAPYIPGDDGQPCDANKIEWLNPTLVREGEDFIQRNSFGLFLAANGALLYGFSFKTLTSVLLRTGGFGLGDPIKSMVRHIETGLHISKWYNTDILDTSSAGFKDLQLVRRMHTRALARCQTTPLNLISDAPNKEEKLALMEAIRKDLDLCIDMNKAPKHVLTYHPDLYFSQFDMAMTQYGFFSPVLLFPESLGIDKKGLEGYVHLWAIFGRMLGIEDRFNIALHPNIELHLKILYNLGLPSLWDMDLTILHLQQTYIDGMSGLLLYSPPSLKSSLLFGLQSMQKAFPELKGDNLHALMDWKDKLWAFSMRSVIYLVGNVSIVRKFVNTAMKAFTKNNHQRLAAIKSSKKFNKTPSTSASATNLKGTPTKVIHQRA